MATIAYIPAAEAAFIADLDQSDMNRMFDEHLVPEDLLSQEGGMRGFTRLSAVFACFYRRTADIYTAQARLRVIREATEHVRPLDNRSDIVNLVIVDAAINWKIIWPRAEIDLHPWVTEVSARAREVELAHQLVTSDPEILRGEPVFSGTRVPIDNVLASADGDISPARLRASYPFLTPAHIEAARTYAAVHPRRGRPRRLSEIDPRWQLARSTVIERRS